MVPPWELEGHGAAAQPVLSQERPKPRVPVLHFRAARPPFVICVKLVSVGPWLWAEGDLHRMGDRLVPSSQAWVAQVSGGGGRGVLKQAAFL